MSVQVNAEQIRVEQQGSSVVCNLCRNTGIVAGDYCRCQFGIVVASSGEMESGEDVSY